MALIVHKYGGTSMGSVERIRNVAQRVAKWHRAGHRLVVVPSAMSGETNRLIGLARELQAQPDPRELDMIASTGEQVSVGLLAIALKAIGVDAVSYAGWQVPIRTDDAFTKARITSIDDARVRAELDAGRVVIVTGFQGVDPAGHRVKGDDIAAELQGLEEEALGRGRQPEHGHGGDDRRGQQCVAAHRVPDHRHLAIPPCASSRAGVEPPVPGPSSATTLFFDATGWVIGGA